MILENTFAASSDQAAATDHFIGAVRKAVHEAQTIAVFRDLSPQEKVAVIATGTLTGLLSVLFAGLKDNYRAGAFEYVTLCLPVAKFNAIELVASEQQNQSSAGSSA